MKPLLLVDGYNILGAWDAAVKNSWSIDEGRDKLTHALIDYAGYAGIEVVLVFDGHLSERRQRSRETMGDVTVVFTKQGETADQYIEACAHAHPKHRPLHVATSDLIEQVVVMGRGAIRLSARELLTQMQMVRTRGREAQAAQPLKRNTFASYLTPEQQERLERIRRER